MAREITEANSVRWKLRFAMFDFNQFSIKLRKYYLLESEVCRTCYLKNGCVVQIGICKSINRSLRLCLSIRSRMSFSHASQTVREGSRCDDTLSHRVIGVNQLNQLNALITSGWWFVYVLPENPRAFARKDLSRSKAPNVACYQSFVAISKSHTWSEKHFKSEAPRSIDRFILTRKFILAN